MKKIEKVVKTVYIAEDGKEFELEEDCLKYEEYSKINFEEEINKYFNFDTNKENPYDAPFTCCVQIKEVPTKLIEAYSFMSKLSSYFDRSAFCTVLQYNSIGTLWCNDWTEAYSGGYGFNGWTKLGDKTTFRNELRKIQGNIEILQKLQEG